MAQADFARSFADVIDMALQDPARANQQLYEAQVELSQRADQLLILMSVFRDQAKSVECRQAAGLLVNRTIDREASNLVTGMGPSLISPSIRECCNLAMEILGDEQHDLRGTASSIVATIIKTESPSRYKDILTHLNDIVQTTNQHPLARRLGSWDTILKIAADISSERENNNLSENVDENLVLAQFFNATTFYALGCVQHGMDEAIMIYNFQVLTVLVGEGSRILKDYGHQMDDYCDRLWTMCGYGATNLSTNVHVVVLRGMVALLRVAANYIMDNGSEALTQYLVKSLYNSEYNIRFEAAAVWDLICSHLSSADAIHSFIGLHWDEFFTGVLQNTPFSHADYEIMDPEQFLDDGGGLPTTALHPSSHHSNTSWSGFGGGLDICLSEDQDDEDQSGLLPWGSGETTRKKCAMIVDRLSNSLGAKTKDILLPPIIERYRNTELIKAHKPWEVKESMLLSLGAIRLSLFTHHPEIAVEIAEQLISATWATVPLVRTVALWSLREMIIALERPAATSVRESISSLHNDLMSCAIMRLTDSDRFVSHSGIELALKLLESEHIELNDAVLLETSNLLAKALPIVHRANARRLMTCIETFATCKTPNGCSRVTGMITPVLRAFSELFLKLPVTHPAAVAAHQCFGWLAWAILDKDVFLEFISLPLQRLAANMRTAAESWLLDQDGTQAWMWPGVLESGFFAVCNIVYCKETLIAVDKSFTDSLVNVFREALIPETMVAMKQPIEAGLVEPQATLNVALFCAVGDIAKLKLADPVVDSLGEHIVSTLAAHVPPEDRKRFDDPETWDRVCDAAQNANWCLYQYFITSVNGANVLRGRANAIAAQLSRSIQFHYEFYYGTFMDLIVIALRLFSIASTLYPESFAPYLSRRDVLMTLIDHIKREPAASDIEHGVAALRAMFEINRQPLATFKTELLGLFTMVRDLPAVNEEARTTATLFLSHLREIRGEEEPGEIT